MFSVFNSFPFVAICTELKAIHRLFFTAICGATLRVAVQRNTV